MRLVETVVETQNRNGYSQVRFTINATPVGSVLAGAAALWIGAKAVRFLGRRGWLPIAAALGIWALRQWKVKTKEHTEEE